MVPLRFQLGTHLAEPFLFDLELVEVRALFELFMLLLLLRARRRLTRLIRHGFPLVGHDLPAVGVGAGLALRLPRLRFRVGPGLQGQQRLLRLRGEVGRVPVARRVGLELLAQGRARVGVGGAGDDLDDAPLLRLFGLLLLLGGFGHGVAMTARIDAGRRGA